MRKALPRIFRALRAPRRLCMLIVGMLTAFSSYATNFVVTSLANTGAGTLRAAIIAANADNTGPHTITFSVSGVINVTTSLPTIIKPVTIDGGNTITISGPGGDNHIGLIVLGAGSSGSTIKNMALRNTGLEPVLLTAALSNITLEKLTTYQTGTHYANHAVMANAAVTGLKIINMTVTGVQDNWYGLRFNSTVTNLTIDGFKVSGGGGLKARGMHFGGVVNGAIIKNCLVDMDDPATADDGDYGIVFNNHVTNVTIDSSTFRDAEYNSIYFMGNSTINNFAVKNSTFDNLDGWVGTQMIRFETTTNANTLLFEKNTFNADLRNTTDDGEYGIVIGCNNIQNTQILSNTFIEHDGSGIHIGSNGTNNTDNLTINGNTFTRNGRGVAATGGMRIYVRNATADADSVRITGNIFNGNNGNAIGVFAGSNVQSIVQKFAIRRNTIYSTQSAAGGVHVQYVNKVVITENSIFNNVGKGIELGTGGNCAYEGVNTPTILSSTETTPGVYTLTVKMPTICGTGNCSLEIFSSAAKVTGVGGQHYVTTRTGLASGNQTLTGVTAAWPEINGAPYGTWTATLKVNNNCGTSEFSNKLRVKIVGPAGVNTGIKLWLRGDELLADGTTPASSGQLISGWDELSGGGAPNSYTIVNNPLTKLNGINFNPVADMDGDIIRGVFTGAASWITNNALTTVAVMNPLSITASNDRLFVLFSQSGVDYNTNHAQIEFFRTGNNIQSYRGNTLLNPPIAGLTGVSAFNKPGIFTSYTTPTAHSAYYNGLGQGSGAYNKGNFAISQWFVGGGWGPNPDGSGGNTWYYAGETDFAEVFTYNRNLTAAELQRVHSYMAMKYGIALKQSYMLSNGAVIWDVAANAAYSKEVAALVRDDLSILEQKQAKAFQADEVATIALGAVVAPTNNENDGVISNDLSVLIWGNDSASTAFTLPFAGAKANTRMVRKWKVQKTNWADQEITVKLNKGREGHYLLISTDPTFATVSQELPVSNDGTVTFNSSLLANNVYFTFGREQKSPGGVLTSLDVWVKADEGVNLAGTNTMSWEDQGPSMRLWGKVGTSVLPYLPAGINYNPAVTFIGPTNSYFAVAPFTSTYTQGEVFSVQSSAVNNVAGFPFQLGGSSGTTTVYYRFTDNNMYLHWGTNTRRQFSYGAKNMALPVILNLNTAANSWTASLDGKIASGPVAYPTSFAQNGTNNAIGVGYGSYFNGPISEVIQYKRKLNATERAQVNSYMALKYGITLDQSTGTNYIASDGTTTMWSATDNGTFKFNIAGIGRDDKGTLLQKQSRSINTTGSGNLVSVAVGSELAASNPENTDTITNDKSFLTWADNNAGVTYTTNIAGDKVTLRMARIWKVDKTNWADRNITIKLHGSASNTYLLISNTDATFATLDQELPVNADSTITINSDLLPDGAYFTFAKEMKGPGFVNSGVQFWLRADDGVSSPAEWNDYSGNDNSAAQANTTFQPKLNASSVNFNPAFTLDGANDYLDFRTNAGIAGANQFTVLSVTKRNTISTADAILAQGTDATNGIVYYYAANNGKFAYGATNGTVLASTGSYTTPKLPALHAATRGASNLFTLYTNGAADGTVTAAINALTTNLRLGWRGGAIVDQFDGDINEVIVYNRALNTDELKQANSYLALKYGITLANGTTDYIATDGTTRMWTVSKNGTFNKNIAGIGRDEKTGLFQKQSRSASDTTITIAAGTAIAADNASNTADFDDLSFFTWADNAGATTFSVAVTSVTNTTSRMARVWKVDRTNWVDQDITIKVAPGGERYLLVHATDPAFGTGATEYQINTMTGTVTLNTADLPDGAFFTIGTKIAGPGCVNNGIATWLRADYAAGVDSWIDFSGNQTNAAQSNAGLQPDYNATLNYNPAFTFNGTNDHLIIPNAAIAGKYSFGAGQRTVIGVGATAKATGYGMMFAYGVTGAGTGTYLGQGAGASNAGFGGYNSATYNVDGPANSLPLNNARIIGGRYNGTTGFLDVNGNQLTALNTTWNTNATAPAYIGVGVATTNQYWSGKVGEVIVYNRMLNTDELKRVNSYLAIKYGVTLDQTTATDYIASDGTTIMWNAADNTGYHLRITGIGRDDCTNLYQKQSISANAGILAVGVGDSIATTNQLNTAEITNDNSYFVFGDDNGAITYTTPVSGLANVTTRMPRIWKVDKTNFADANIAFKLTGGNDKVYLIVSTDNTFDGTDATYQLEANGSVQLSSAEIPDGAYFTFGKQLNGPGYVNVGVALWLRADDNVSTSETWIDYSGNDNDANQADGLLQPVFTDATTNYNPGFVFAGAQQMSMNVSKFPVGNSARTLIGVGTPNNVTGNRYMIGWGAAATSQYNALINVNNTMTYSGFGNDVSAAAGSAVIGVPQEMMATWAGGTGTAALYSKMRLMGSAAKTWTTGTAGGAYIGMLSPNTQYWNGSINELIVYNRAIADFERLRISSYLALKYGYTLDQTAATNYVATDWDGSTGTIYWNATANAAYNKNIAGIGRDDKTGLYQKQSRSVNTASFGNMVAMGLNTIEATNKDNTGIIDDDMSFLVWGDNGLTGLQVTEYPLELNPGGCSRITRLQREWKVQKTGTVNGVQLQLFLASQVPSSTAAGDIKLLIDTDGDFGNGGTTIIDVSGYDAATQVVTFDNVSFNNGDYFTLVTDLTNQAPGGVTGNLLTWHRADKGINATGTVVNGWLDQGGFAKDLLPAVAGTSNPAYNTTTGLINFNPVLTYDGTNDVMSNSTLNHTASTNGEDIFAVVLPNAVAGFQDIVGLGTVTSTNTATELRFDANRLQYLANNGAVTSITNPVTTNGLVQLANGNRSNTGAASLLVNGNVVSSGAMGQLPTSTQLNIGSRRAAAANSFYFNGKIAEVAVYNKQLSNEERMKVASYLAIKYGITLSHDYVDPANTVVWSLTGNTGYNYNITGIGRDDCNGLHQKQSKSVNANEALVTIGHGLGISATNAGNTNVMENVTALLLGDDNGVRNAFTATGAPSGRERIARTWKVQETGTIGTVSIQVPANSSAAAVKLPLERDGVVYMLVNNSNNFTTGATEVPMTLNGDNWEATYDFSNGDYFTFATNDACVTTQAILSNYNEVTTAATDKCYVNGWILFRSPTDATKYIAAIYDPAGLIDRSKITASIDVDAAFADLGKGSSTQAARLMRRLLQIDCASCYDAVANPNPAFTVRMFYTPDEKAGAESVETNNITEIKTANGLTDPQVFKWFKAAGKTAAEVVSGLTASGGIAAGGQEWADGVLPTGQADGVDYIDFTGVNGFSTFGGIWLVNLNQALPVTWQHVQAAPAGDRTILVKWSTSEEKNNAGFDVERSEDATNFVSIGKVNSNGNSNATVHYSFNDNNVLPGAKYYYRIRQTDIDGRVSYSKIVSASLDAQGDFYMRIANNPVRNQLVVEVAMDRQQKLQTFITDVSGKLLSSRLISAQQGKSTITTDMSPYADGIYFIRVVTSDGKSRTEKFTIQKGR